MTIATEISILDDLRGLEGVIRGHAVEAEERRHLSQPVIDALTDAGMFRINAPRSLGGLEADPLTFYKAVELLSSFDGSTGWCAFINGGGGFETAFLPDSAAEALWSDRRAIIAGALFPFGKAVATDGGYRVSGRWPYASGSTHATWLLGFCMAHDGDQPRMTPMGPELRVMHFRRADVEILQTWDVMGLSGTGSNDFAARDVFVPEANSWMVRPGAPRGSHFQSPLYRFPFMGVFAFAMAAVALGIAQGAITTAIDVAKSKVPVRSEVTLRERPLFQRQMADAISAVNSARAWLHQVVRETWEAVETGQDIGLAERGTFQLAASHATRSAAQAVDLAYMASGGSANYRTSPLQRAFRDVHAVSQHVATAPQSIEAAGKVLMGLPPDNPLLLL